MSDSISGDLGRDAGSNAVGKDIQHVTLNLGNRSTHEISEILSYLPRISEIVLGDGIRWDGVVQELRKLEQQFRQLTENVVKMQLEMVDMQHQLEKRKEYGRIQTLLTLVLIALVLLVLVIVLFR